MFINKICVKLRSIMFQTAKWTESCQYLNWIIWCDYVARWGDGFKSLPPVFLLLILRFTIDFEITSDRNRGLVEPCIQESVHHGGFHGVEKENLSENDGVILLSLDAFFLLFLLLLLLLFSFYPRLFWSSWSIACVGSLLPVPYRIVLFILFS